MQCRVFNMTTGKEEDTTDLLVFARAYHAAWRSMHAAEPAGWHRIMTLGIVLDFGQVDPSANESSGRRSASGAPSTNPESPGNDALRGERDEK